ncbi:MAG: sigma-54-dependent Fis family transcriptional regulator [Verrucomicrobia bacterium]|nr:sigma-54-dependent Fis family transcriptional regulator [Cytophagales bacterium]
MLLKNATILAIDDDPDVLLAVKMLLKPEVKEIVTEKNPELMLTLLSKQKFDLVLLDMNFKSALNTGNEGFFWLRKILEKDKNMPVIMITAYGDIDIAVRTIKEGAADFVLKPWRNEKLLETLQNIINHHSTEDKKNSKEEKKSVSAHLQFPFRGLGGFIGNSEIMQDVFYKIEKIAPTDANVLILGENGTGKDLLARDIHAKSLRFDKPFVAVDLGALTESLFESELFGYKKGAFTDAKDDRVGRFEEANSGTLFLDEIGNIGLPQQAKLLSVLQNRQVARLGTNQLVNIDIRLISATNAPIYAWANENRFRKDLIYRLNTIEITLPPLRERGEDIILLANHFISNYTEKYKKSSQTTLSEEAVKKLKNYTFPGNIRELQHTIERAIIMAESEIILAKDLSFSTLENPLKNTNAPIITTKLVELEKVTIQQVIDKYNGNISKAAKELGITRTALYRRLGKYDI